MTEPKGLERYNMPSASLPTETVEFRDDGTGLYRSQDGGVVDSVIDGDEMMSEDGMTAVVMMQFVQVQRSYRKDELETAVGVDDRGIVTTLQTRRVVRVVT